MGLFLAAQPCLNLDECGFAYTKQEKKADVAESGSRVFTNPLCALEGPPESQGTCYSGRCLSGTRFQETVEEATGRPERRAQGGAVVGIAIMMYKCHILVCGRVLAVCVTRA